MQNQKTWEEILSYVNSFLDEKEKGWLKDYMEAGEEGLAFELVAGYVLNKKVPLTKELYDWIQWYGIGSEEMGIEIDPDWKKIKLT